MILGFNSRTRNESEITLPMPPVKPPRDPLYLLNIEEKLYSNRIKALFCKIRQSAGMSDLIIYLYPDPSNNDCVVISVNYGESGFIRECSFRLTDNDDVIIAQLMLPKGDK